MRVEILVLFLILDGKVISLSPLSRMLAAGLFFADALFQAEEVPFSLSFLTVFFKNQGQMSEFVKWMVFLHLLRGFLF